MNSQQKCPYCGFENTIWPGDISRGRKECGKCRKHFGLKTATVYSEKMLEHLPNAGLLFYKGVPEDKYLLTVGKNVIGRGGTIKLRRYEHKGQCFISREHCVIRVKFDAARGELHYFLEDGHEGTPSTNGTFYKGEKLGSRGQKITWNLPDGAEINLGGEDTFILRHYVFPDSLKEQYALKEVSNGGTE